MQNRPVSDDSWDEDFSEKGRMEIGNSEFVLGLKQVLRDGDKAVSRRTFNLIIGGMVLLGFLLNYLTVVLAGEAVARFAYTKGGSVFIILGYLVCAFIGARLVVTPHAVKSTIGYLLIAVPVGLLLCITVEGTDIRVVRDAVIYTGLISALFIALGAAYPDFFLKMGRVLLVSLGILIIGELILWFIAGAPDISWLFAGIFCCYIGYDWARCSKAATTVDNAVDIAANLYLDIINLLLRIIRILNRARRDN